MKATKWTYFWCGMTACASLLGIIEDFLGCEKYIEFVRKYWVSGYISMPITILGLCAVYYIMSKKDE